jgi:hypothetical protein
VGVPEPWPVTSRNAAPAPASLQLPHAPVSLQADGSDEMGMAMCGAFPGTQVGALSQVRGTSGGRAPRPCPAKKGRCRITPRRASPPQSNPSCLSDGLSIDFRRAPAGSAAACMDRPMLQVWVGGGAAGLRPHGPALHPRQCDDQLPHRRQVRQACSLLFVAASVIAITLYVFSRCLESA